MTRLLVSAAAFVMLAVGAALAAWGDEATNRNLIERGGAELGEAQRLHFAGRLDAARSKAARATLLFQQVETQRTRDPEAAFLLIQAAVFAGDLEGAKRWLETYATRTAYGERDANLHYARGLVLLILEQRSAAAVASLEQMQRLAPRSRDRGRDTLYFHALFAEGGRLIRERAPARAVPVLQKAARAALRLGDRRKELAARSNVGIAWHLGGHAEEARQVFDRLAKEDAANLVWPFHLGLALDALGRPDEAVGAYERVIEGLESAGARPSSHEVLEQAYLRLGHAKREQADVLKEALPRREHLEAARRAFESFVQRAPKDARGHRALGTLLYEALARPYEAIPSLETAHALDPACDTALALLIEIAQRHPAPPPTEGEAAVPAADWAARRRAWEQDYTTHREVRQRERAERKRRSLDGSDGCR